MELLKKISDHELKLILVFFTLMIFVGSYQLGYQRYHHKAGRLATENTNLRIQMSELQTKEENSNNIIKNTADMTTKAASLLKEFPTGLSQEKSTLFVSGMALFSGMKITTISYEDSTVFYSDTNAPESAAGTGFTAETTAAAGTNAAVGTTQTMGMAAAAGTNMVGGANITSGTDSTAQPVVSGYTGYKTAVTIAYQTTYEGLKKSIRYINEYDERMNVIDLTASFDNTTGNLTGVMTIELFAVNGRDRVPEEPVIPGVQLGTDNIFGSFEIPLEGVVFDE